MALILNIETSTKVCSVALSTGGNVVFSRENREGGQHASLLGVYVSEALDWIGSQEISLDAVAVSSGPGSYTGLRIGVSLAKGLCYGLGIPLIALSPLKVMADAVIRSGVKGDFYCPMMDARRMEVYTALFDGDLQLQKEISAVVMDETVFSDLLLSHQIVFFGDGSDKCKPLIRSSKAVFVDSICPLADDMVYLSDEAWKDKQFVDLAYFEPFYLKEFMATTPKNKVFL